MNNVITGKRIFTDLKTDTCTHITFLSSVATQSCLLDFGHSELDHTVHHQNVMWPNVPISYHIVHPSNSFFRSGIIESSLRSRQPKPEMFNDKASLYQSWNSSVLLNDCSQIVLPSAFFLVLSKNELRSILHRVIYTPSNKLAAQELVHIMQ